MQKRHEEMRSKVITRAASFRRANEACCDAFAESDRLMTEGGDVVAMTMARRTISQAAELATQELELLIAEPSISLDEVVAKLQIWYENTVGSHDRSDDLSPMDQLVLSSFEDLKRFK